MKKILSFLLLFSIAIGYSQNYVAVTDKCPLISFSETNLQNISANKADIKLTQTSSQVIVNIIGGGNQAIYWSVAQARAYGYSLDSLYNHILDILKVQCDTSGGGGVSQTLSISGDTLSISGGNSVVLPVYVQVDSTIITSYDVLNSQNAPPGSPATGDIYLVGTVPTGAWVGHAKDIAEWNGSAWVFTDGVQGDFLYNATTALTYIFRSGNWVQTTGIPALNNGNTISSGLTIGTNNARSLNFETNNINRGRFDSIGRFHVYNLPTSSTGDTFVPLVNTLGKFTKQGKSTFLAGVSVGSSDSFFFTKTKADIDTLIAGDDLVAGALYEITGVHPTLYDDGTTSGTTVYLRAISGSELEVQGMGKFYNPKYNQAVDGFGIWENKMYGTFSSISGTFDYQNKEAVTANNAATGILLADGMIQWVSGDWSAATGITGDVSSATATVAGFVTPTYSIGDKVIWGGYSWTNVNGNVGASTDVLNLNAEWTKNVYDTTNYNIAYDVIEYDYTNDMIIRRFEKESNVDVKCSKAQFDLFMNDGFPYHSISVQQFGNSLNLSTGKGQLNINVNGGYNESVNFCGSSQTNLTFGQNASQSNLTFGQNASQSNLTFRQNAFQGNLTFGHNASQGNLTFGQHASQGNLTFGQDASQGNLTFGQYASQGNLTFGQYANQGNLTFGQNASQSNLTFDDNIIQTNIEFDINTQLDYNSQTLSTSINNARFRTNGGVVTIPNISTATYIYDNTLLKDIYTRPDGTLRLKYMNNSDVLVVRNITD